MTESTPIDPTTADRLARLRQRHPTDAATPPRDAAPTATGATATGATAAGARSAATRKPGNGSPAAGSKIVATGASVMAVLGMVALFGRQAGSNSAEAAVAVQTPAVALASSPSSNIGVEPPNVVALVDAENTAVVASPSPVVAPTRVELAIPVPRQVVVSQAAPNRAAVAAPQPAAAPALTPAPAAAPNPAPAPAPAPVATTQGS